MSNDTQIRDKVYNYVIESTFGDKSKVGDDTLLFEEGIFDSMGLLLLIEFLKDEYNVQTGDEELVVENFESINAIVSFTREKLNGN